MNWPDTREQSMLDTDDASLDAWIARGVHSLKITSRAWRRYVYRGPFCFENVTDWDRGDSGYQGHGAVYVRTGRWIFGRWELVFWRYEWVGFISGEVKAVVRNAVWQLVREGETADRVRASTRHHQLMTAVKGKR